jgi:hypothetical protein
MSDVPYKINTAGVFINPMINTPDFSKKIQSVNHTSLEPYANVNSASSYATVSVPTEARALSFIPEGGNYNVYDGKIQHPRGVFMDKSGVEYPRVPVDAAPKKKQCNKNKHNARDKMLMKYYLAGVSVVGVLILARLLVK